MRIILFLVQTFNVFFFYISPYRSIENGHETDDKQSYTRRPVSMYETRQIPKAGSPVPTSQSFHSTTVSPAHSSKLMPLFIEVEKRTDKITRRIQELWKSIQEQMPDFKNQEIFVPCSERIHLTIMELNSIFPSIVSNEDIKNALILLNSNSLKIQKVCCDLQNAIVSDNKQQLELFLQDVRNCAYDLAAANKALITSYPK